MTKRQRSKATNNSKPHVDDEFFNAFNPTFSFEILGHQFKGRALTIGDFMELKQHFKSWKGFDIATLLNEHEFEALVEICWLGMKNLNENVPDKNHLQAMINVNTFEVWAAVWRQMAGLSPADDEVAVGEDEGEVPLATSSETGNTSSP